MGLDPSPPPLDVNPKIKGGKEQTRITTQKKRGGKRGGGEGEKKSFLFDLNKNVHHNISETCVHHNISVVMHFCFFLSIFFG